MANRRTLASEVHIKGVTLHAGVPAQLRLRSSPPGSGILFQRADLEGTAPIPALWSCVAETRLGTVLRGADGASVGVVEHLLAALAGAEIDDCLVEIDGPEVPVLAGDALSYLDLIDPASVQPQGALATIKVKQDVTAVSRPSAATLLPARSRALC